jgi:hypothetical protein
MNREAIPLRPLWIGLALTGGLVLWRLALASGNDRLSALLAAAVLAAALFALLGILRLPVLSPPVLYLSVFALFHLGLAAPWGLGLYEDRLPWWFISNRLTPALGLVLLAIASYAAGALLTGQRKAASSTGTPGPNSLYFGAGVAICLLGGAMFFLGVQSLGGARFLEAGYSEMYRLTAQFDPRLFGTSFTVIPIGLYLTAAASPPPWRLFVCLLTGLWVAGVFYLGFRGFALIAGLVVLAVLRQRGYRLPLPAAAALLAVVLLAIPAARAVRDQPPGQRSLAGLAERLNPLDGIAEMGGSLRPLVHTLTYLEYEPWRWGGTYWRSLATVWPNLAWRWSPGRHIPIEELPPNHWLTLQAAPGAYRRHGGLGFSGVAEPYMNFGAPGVVAYFLALGALLTRATRLAMGRPPFLAAWAMVLGPLLWTTRNGFEVFFRPAVWGLLTVWALHLSARFLRSCRLAAPPAPRTSHARTHCQ